MAPSPFAWLPPRPRLRGPLVFTTTLDESERTARRHGKSWSSVAPSTNQLFVRKIGETGKQCSVTATAPRCLGDPHSPPRTTNPASLVQVLSGQLDFAQDRS
eukprot:6207502-Pleurochrysis_carterae.AAC.4